MALAVTGLLAFIGFNGVGMPMGDLNLAYQNWMNEGKAFGLSEDWVYPYPALVPMIFADFVSPGALIGPWLMGTAILLAAVSGYVTWRSPERGFRASVFWLSAIVLLGPVAISRLDILSAAIAVIGVFVLSRNNEATASIWLTVATWLKVWPIALLASLLTASKRRLQVFTVIALANAAIVLIGALLGGDASIFSFLFGQTSRGIQIEAPLAGFWLVPAMLGNQAFGIEYNYELMTYEVFGGNPAPFASLMSLVQIGALGITVWLGLRATKMRAMSSEVIFWVSFTGVLDLIVFNKVGSPQYLTWLAVPVVFGILTSCERLLVPLVSVLALSALTWLIYPVLYDSILQSDSGATLILVVRNLGLIALLVFANLRLQKLGNQRTN